MRVTGDRNSVGQSIKKSLVGWVLTAVLDVVTLKIYVKSGRIPYPCGSHRKAFIIARGIVEKR